MKNKVKEFLIILGLISSSVGGWKLPESATPGTPLQTTTRPIPTPPVTILTRTTTISTSTVTEPPTTTTERGLPADFCEGISFGIMPHPHDCTQYVICISEAPYVVSCGPYEVFYNGSCVEGNPATCDVITITNEPTTTEPTTTPTTTTTEPTTTSTTTIEPTTSLTTTTEPTTTSTTTTKPTTTSTTTTEPTTTSTTIDTTTTERGLPDDFCTGISFDTFPHPYNCIQFVVCVYGNPNIIDCLANEVFFDGFCVPGDPTTCEVFAAATMT